MKKQNKNQDKLFDFVIKAALILAAVGLMAFQFHQDRVKKDSIEKNAVWEKIKNLEKVSDPHSFALNFDTTGRTQTHLETRVPKGQAVESPFYPYSDLESTTLKASYPHILLQDGKETDLSEQGVYIYEDPYWNIFWVVISPEGQGYVTEYYGPYQIE